VSGDIVSRLTEPNNPLVFTKEKRKIAKKNYVCAKPLPGTEDVRSAKLTIVY
jgi:hypothetical protein